MSSATAANIRNIVNRVGRGQNIRSDAVNILIQLISPISQITDPMTSDQRKSYVTQIIGFETRMKYTSKNFILGDILELTSNSSRDRRSRDIEIYDIYNVIMNDEQLMKPLITPYIVKLPYITSSFADYYLTGDTPLKYANGHSDQFWYYLRNVINAMITYADKIDTSLKPLMYQTFSAVDNYDLAAKLGQVLINTSESVANDQELKYKHLMQTLYAFTQQNIGYIPKESFKTMFEYIYDSYR